MNVRIFLKISKSLCLTTVNSETTGPTARVTDFMYFPSPYLYPVLTDSNRQSSSNSPREIRALYIAQLSEHLSEMVEFSAVNSQLSSTDCFRQSLSEERNFNKAINLFFEDKFGSC